MGDGDGDGDGRGDLLLRVLSGSLFAEADRDRSRCGYEFAGPEFSVHDPQFINWHRGMGSDAFDREEAPQRSLGNNVARFEVHPTRASEHWSSSLNKTSKRMLCAVKITGCSFRATIDTLFVSAHFGIANRREQRNEEGKPGRYDVTS